MKTAPHLHFQGTCAEAFRFYAEVFGGEIVARWLLAQVH